MPESIDTPQPQKVAPPPADVLKDFEPRLYLLAMGEESLQQMHGWAKRALLTAAYKDSEAAAYELPAQILEETRLINNYRNLSADGQQCVIEGIRAGQERDSHGNVQAFAPLDSFTQLALGFITGNRVPMEEGFTSEEIGEMRAAWDAICRIETIAAARDTVRDAKNGEGASNG